MTTPSAAEQARQKRAAAEWAAELVQSGIVVGLGSGSTAIFALRRIAARLTEGELHDVVGIPTSTGVEATARDLGIPIGTLDTHPVVDLTIDGANEVDPDQNLIKGGGGSLLREKIVAQASRREVIVIDASKLSDRLGTRHDVPIEVISFGWRPIACYLESIGARVTLRLDGSGQPFRTDNGNVILDAAFGSISDPARLSATVLARAGVAEVGLFCGLVTDLVIGTTAGVEHRPGNRPSAN